MQAARSHVTTIGEKKCADFPSPKNCWATPTIYTNIYFSLPCRRWSATMASSDMDITRVMWTTLKDKKEEKKNRQQANGQIWMCTKMTKDKYERKIKKNTKNCCVAPGWAALWTEMDVRSLECAINANSHTPHTHLSFRRMHLNISNISNSFLNYLCAAFVWCCYCSLLICCHNADHFLQMHSSGRCLTRPSVRSIFHYSTLSRIIGSILRDADQWKMAWQLALGCLIWNTSINHFILFAITN